ncbi:MAG: hypothetical protein JSR33_11165 [Proteobacteria bacterium]|nr:hypothetical protein [Pseudomonadota bacterium]
MRILICLATLFAFTSAQAGKAVFPDVSGSQYKLVMVMNNQGLGEVYIENNQHIKTLLYKASFPYSNLSIFSADETENKDILMVDFECGTKEKKTICTRLFNRRTNQVSILYADLLGMNAKKNVAAYYLNNKNLIIIAPVFDTCQNPFTYSLKLFPNSMFGTKTQFLKNGDLRLDYAEAKTGKDTLKIIQINYQQLFNHCKTG